MRLITRADLDGLTCALLLKSVEPIDDIRAGNPATNPSRRRVIGLEACPFEG